MNATAKYALYFLAGFGLWWMIRRNAQAAATVTAASQPQQDMVFSGDADTYSDGPFGAYPWLWESVVLSQPGGPYQSEIPGLPGGASGPVANSDDVLGSVYDVMIDAGTVGLFGTA